MKKAIILAIAGALATPSAFAAEDTSGMLYTSASEGFYASVRAAYESGKVEGKSSTVGNSSSRFGVRGTNDLGGGLEGFYQYEAGVSIDNGGPLSTRLGHVGLRGAFGEVVFGSIWTNTYNWVYSSTDIGNAGAGNFAYTDLRPGRDSNVVQYTSPDLSGFQGSFLVQMADNSAPAKVEVSATPTVGEDGTVTFAEDAIEASSTAAVKDDNDLDKWIVSAKYEFGGITAAGTYANKLDGLATIDADGNTGVDDAAAWALRLGYGQDNWNVNGWYGMDNSGDISDAAEDVKTFSLAGSMSIDQSSFYVAWEQQDSGVDNSVAVFGVQYNLGVNSRVWANYIARDNDADASEDDYVSIGLRHDF